ncbi:methylated-DNA--[protein]-cysteine S-methyltransferase [Bacillus sp. B190/17]|uniref:Methylated-DNA--[protein]-cysteine S-methyltransferase n=1 Tax=Bacillus lumedeiriae TaxID=3058829 RepID=A0ABW8I7B8_9BACI
MNTKEQIIHWSTVDCGQWPLYAAQTKKGLCYVGSPGQSYEEFEASIRKRFPQAFLVKSEETLKIYTDELREYFEGTRQSFSFPIDIKGTPFQEEIWKALKQIPYGNTYSYSDIAERIQKPKAVRAVGTAIGANPVLITIPCHRVIGKNGAITGYRGGIEMKQYLLQLESQHKEEKLLSCSRK